MFYTREEQPARQAAWFIGNSIAVLLGVSIDILDASKTPRVLKNKISITWSNIHINRD
jgi:hypothetical protein